MRYQPFSNSNNRTNRIAYHTGDSCADSGACADRCRRVKSCEGSHADAGSAHVYFSAANRGPGGDSDGYGRQPLPPVVATEASI